MRILSLDLLLLPAPPLVTKDYALKNERRFDPTPMLGNFRDSSPFTKSTVMSRYRIQQDGRKEDSNDRKADSYLG
jgi:hypothetical protein